MAGVKSKQIKTKKETFFTAYLILAPKKAKAKKKQWKNCLLFKKPIYFESATFATVFTRSG